VMPIIQTFLLEGRSREQKVGSSAP
jgi:hypothetical protein